MSFYKRKPFKVGKKTFDQHFDAKLKKNVFLLNFASYLLLFLNVFSAFFCIKMLKKTIMTSVWGVQHPIPGRRIQQITSYKLTTNVSVTYKKYIQ